jgi:hypothetical protein
MTSDRSLVAIAAGIVITAVAAIAVIVLLGDRPPSGFPPDSPQGSLLEYVRAWEDDDYEAAYAFFSKRIKASVTLEQYRSAAEQQEQFGYPGALGQRVVLEKVDQKGDRADVDLRFEVSVPIPFLSTDFSSTRTLRMVAEDGAWRLDQALLGLDPDTSGLLGGDFPFPGDFPTDFPEPSPAP